MRYVPLRINIYEYPNQKMYLKKNFKTKEINYNAVISNYNMMV